MTRQESLAEDADAECRRFTKFLFLDFILSRRSGGPQESIMTNRVTTLSVALEINSALLLLALVVLSVGGTAAILYLIKLVRERHSRNKFR